eukprot:jgi/Psemu1/426/gm1.426_g
MSAHNLLCFNTSCSRHVEFTQMRSSICACFPIIFDFAKKHPYWLLHLTIPVPGLVEGLVYHESCLSLCSCQLITKAIPPGTQSDPFTSTSTSLELHLPTTIDTQNLYCPIHMLPPPCYSESTNSKEKRITSKGKLTTFPNSSWRPSNRRGSVYTSGAQINRPYPLKKQNKIDQEHIKHQNTVDGNLDSSGIKTLEKLTNVNPNLTGLRNQAISNFCPLLDIEPGEFIIYHLSVTGQELCYSPNPDSFPFDVQPFSLQTNSTSQSNGLRDRILLNEYDQCFFDQTNFCNSTDGGGIILQDQECLTFSLNSITDRFASKLLGPDLNSLSNIGKGCPCLDKPGTSTLSCRLYDLGNSSASAHLPMLDEIHMGTRSTDVGLVDSPVSSHLQTLDEIRIGAGSTDVSLVNLSVHSQMLDRICMGSRSTNVASVNLSADTDDIQRATKSLVGIKPHKDCTPSIDKDTPNISQPVGKNLTQTSLLDPHESNLSQSTDAALLAIMGSDSDKSKPMPSIASKSLVPNLVPPPESCLDCIDSNSDDSLPPPVFPPNPPAQIYKLTTNAPASHPIQSPASASNLVAPELAISQSDSTSMIHSISFLLAKSYNLENTEMKQLLENIVVGERPVSNQEAQELSKAVRGLFNNNQGIMTPTALNVIKKVTKPQPIIDTRTLSNQISLLKDSKLVKTKELRALLFVLNIRYKSTMSKLRLRELLSDALSQKWFSDVVHPLESNVTHGKLKISDNPSYVREAIMGSKLKNPSDYINLYCKAANSDFNNCNSEHELIDRKHQIERDNAYAELYRLEEGSRTTQKIGCVVQNGSEFDTDWESPPPSPVQGMDTGQLKFTRSSNHLQYIQSNGSPADGKMTNRCDNTEALTIECRDKNPAQFVNWKKDKNVLMIAHPVNPDIRIPIYDCIIDWRPPKPERIKVGRLDFSLMSMVRKFFKNYFQDLEESINDKWSEIYGLSATIMPSEYIQSATKKIQKLRLKIDSWTFHNKVDLREYKQGLAVVNQCVLRLGTSINKGDCRLEITQPKLEKILMSLVFGHASESNELSLPQPEKSTLMRLYFQCDQAGLSTILSFFNKCHEENEENQGLEPVLIDRELAHCFGVFLHRQKHANNLNKNRSFLSRFLGLPMSQFLMEKVARKSWPIFVDLFKEDRSCASGLPKTSWDSYKTFVDDYWAMLYKYLSSDKEEYRKSINFDFAMTPKRRLYIIPLNLGGSHWAANLVFHASNGHYSAIQLDPMIPKSKFPCEKESLILAKFFHTNANKKNPIIHKNRYLEMCFSSFPIQKGSFKCGQTHIQLDKEHDETSAGISATAIKNEFGSFLSGMCPVEFQKEYADFIKVLRQKYNQLGIEGVDGKITDVLTNDYGGDNSKLLDVWSENIEKRKMGDTELKSENKISTSYKTKLSMTNSVQKSKSEVPKVGVSVKEKPVDSFNNNEGGQKFERPTEREPTGSKTTTLEAMSTETQSPETSDIRGIIGCREKRW